MQINWLTLVAQIINFLILAYLLKRFLYGPIIKAMDEREARIAAELREAEEKRQQAQEEAQRFYERRTELEENQQRLLDEANEQAEGRRKELIRAARREAEELQQRWQDALEREKAAFLASMRRRAGDQICAITARALGDLSDRSLQEQMISAFLARLRQLGESDRQAVAQSAGGSGNRLEVQTAFDPGPETRASITQAIREQIGDAVDVTFRVNEELICGIELKCDGLKLSWTVAEYLHTLEESLSRALAEEAAELT